jgi:quinol monooxygenase YgiN
VETCLPAVVELRQYTLHPGRRDDLIELFEREFIESQEDAGMALIGLFRDAARPDRFVWLRGFADMEARKNALQCFYGGPVWRAHRQTANATMVDSNNVLLLRPLRSRPWAEPAAIRVSRPLLCLTYALPDAAACDAFARRFCGELRSELARRGGSVLGTFVTEAAENTYPQLPVREGEQVVVVLTAGVAPEDVAAFATPAETTELLPTSRSRVQHALRGRPGDFDFLTGGWNVTHTRLHQRLRASTQWEILAGTQRGWSLLDGIVSVDEYDFPDNGIKGGSFRHLDLAAERWSIYWTNSASGALFPSVSGGFDGDYGEFYGEDVEDGTPVIARYRWLGCTTLAPRWEQAFSVDGGATWETNWIMEFRRP